MTNIRARLDKLENQAKPGVIVMWRHVDESNDEAKDRWRREHPGEDPDAAGLTVIVVRWTAPVPGEQPFIGSANV